MLNKKIKVNPRYADVKSVVKSGKTMKDVEIISDQLVAKRKGEHFGRIKASTLARYISETSHEESVFGLMKDNEDKENCDTISTTSYAVSEAKSVQSVVTCTTEMLGITAETKFILLDLRDEDEYKQWHIKEAISFPAPNISRDKTFGQLLRFKNQADKIIVVYMSDERAGSTYSKLLFEKGFDNVYLLSGGLEKFLDLHFELVEGTNVPEQAKMKSTMTKFRSEASKTSSSFA